MNFNKPKFVPQSFGQEIIDSFDQSCQLNLDGVYFLSTGTFQLNVLDDLTDVMWMRRLGVLRKITHFQLPCLLVNPDETLFELIFKGPVLYVFEIAVFLSVVFDDFIEVEDFLFEFLDLAGVVFEGALHVLELEVDFSDFLLEVFDLILLFCDYLLHRLVFLFQVIVFFLECFIHALQIFYTVLERWKLLWFILWLSTDFFSFPCP